MTSENKLGMLGRLLHVIQQIVGYVVNFIFYLLTGNDRDSYRNGKNPEFPYYVRDNFLSPAELNFFHVLRMVVGNRAVLLTKVGLGDVFWVKKNDPSRYRIYTNKIDRKHVDFLICHSVTMQPIIGIELDDKSHQRADWHALVSAGHKHAMKAVCWTGSASVP